MKKFLRNIIGESIYKHLSRKKEIYMFNKRIKKFRKKNLKDKNAKEVQFIFQKAELLGKWLRLTGNEQTIYMFLKIRP